MHFKSDFIQTKQQFFFWMNRPVLWYCDSFSVYTSTKYVQLERLDTTRDGL